MMTTMSSPRFGDLMIGVAIGICQESAVCFVFMYVISVLFIIVETWLCGGCGDKFERPSKKQITRGLRIGAAYGATKALRNIK